MPSAKDIFDKLKESSVAKASKALANYVGNGMPTVTGEQRQERLDTCRSCEFIKGTEVNPHCLLCGCYLLIKTRFATEECPAGKWGKVDIEATRHTAAHDIEECCP